jgi:glycosyltransferase involved in cell wall biosynthesis
MYLLSGNAILMSDTKAQKAFLREYPDIGLCYKQDSVQSIVAALKKYIDNPTLLNDHRANSLKLAREKLNWEMEQKIFLDNVKETLGR